MDQPQRDVLWKPDAGIPQDDLTKRPSMRFQLCELCRSVLTSPEVLQPPCENLSGITLCGGTLQETQCSLRAMFLDYCRYDCTRFEGGNPDEWRDYESMKSTLTLKLRGEGLDETILNIHPGPSNEVDWANTRWMRFRVQAYLGKVCRPRREK